MASGLEHLLDEGVISEVLARLQSGKEAEVFVVRCGGQVVAAKVYKDRAQRSFKNNASYKEGRTVRNSRSARAIESGSKFGKAAAEDAWKSAEADALYRLHRAQVRVPAPVMFIDGVLLMELVLDASGNPASRLIDTALTPEQANAGYRDMLTQLVRMLSCDLIHGDLSPYNVLWAAAGPTVIDFPQIVSASQNGSSERFFLRDAHNILGHLARFDRSLGGRRGDAAEIWRAYMRRELTPDFVPSGQAPPRVHANGWQPGRAQGEGQRPAGNAQRPAHGPRPGSNAQRPGHGQRPGGNGDRALHGQRPPGNGQRPGHGQRPPGNAPRPARSAAQGGQAERAANIPAARRQPENERAGGSGAGRPGQRRAPKAPEVLFARPRRAAPASPEVRAPQSPPRDDHTDTAGDAAPPDERSRRPRFR